VLKQKRTSQIQRAILCRLRTGVWICRRLHRCQWAKHKISSNKKQVEQLDYKIRLLLSLRFSSNLKPVDGENLVNFGKPYWIPWLSIRFPGTFKTKDQKCTFRPSLEPPTCRDPCHWKGE